jgi:hypothetical protein
MLEVVKKMIIESLAFFALFSVFMIDFLRAFIALDNADKKTNTARFTFHSMASAVMQSPDFDKLRLFCTTFWHYLILHIHIFCYGYPVKRPHRSLQLRIRRCCRKRLRRVYGNFCSKDHSVPLRPQAQNPHRAIQSC